MSSFSLQKATRSCKVNTDQSERIQSERILNPNHMVCMQWNGTDNLGRQIHPDSWNTKSAGCNYASERVNIENELRPHYFEYTTLDSSGLGLEYPNYNTAKASEQTRRVESNNPSFGNQFTSTNNSCSDMYGYERAMAQMNQSNREATYNDCAYRSNQNKRMAGII